MVRARDLGVPFEGRPGDNNAITDVPGVEVGHATLIDDTHHRSDGSGRIRTGVTIIHPRGRAGMGGVAAGRAVLNGTGEWTGMHVVDEIGRFYGPIALTGSGNIGIVHRALSTWSPTPEMSDDERTMRLLAVVGETLDAQLHDVFGHTLSESDVVEALEGAAAGPVAEGSVGGGTGMMAYEFKGGIGTASRRIESERGLFTVGALVQANHARRDDLIVSGTPIGAALSDLMPCIVDDDRTTIETRRGEADKNSLLMVLGTDAPLLPHQLQRLARRAALGVGRCGGVARNLSGELALAFSTRDAGAGTMLIDDAESDTLSALFVGVVEAVEEAIVNQLVAATDMLGNGNRLVRGLPHDALVALLRQHGRLNRGVARTKT